LQPLPSELQQVAPALQQSDAQQLEPSVQQLESALHVLPLFVLQHEAAFVIPQFCIADCPSADA
jgi:hypothetical protein